MKKLFNIIENHLCSVSINPHIKENMIEKKYSDHNLDKSLNFQENKS